MIKDYAPIVISLFSLAMAAVSLIKSIRQDQRAASLKKPLIDFTLPPIQDDEPHELRYTVRNRGDAPIWLDAVTGSAEWPVVLSPKNPKRRRVRDSADVEGTQAVWTVSVGALIEEGARYDGTVLIERQHAGDRVENYSAAFVFEMSVRDRGETDLRLTIRRMARD